MAMEKPKECTLKHLFVTKLIVDALKPTKIPDLEVPT